MRKIREVLRLYFAAALSIRAIARSLGTSPSTVGDYLRRAKVAGLSWPVPESVDDTGLERRLFPAPPSSRTERPLPDWSEVHRELRRKSVTLSLLWQEYKETHPEGLQYSWFCDQYRAWAGKLDLVMRQDHRAGEKLFVDYAGQTVPVVDRETGGVRQAQVFVAVLGASSYTFAEATWTQTLQDWTASHVRAFEFIGGCPELVVPDNLRSGVSRAHRYEPDLNPTYHDLARHYGVAVLPARVRRPRGQGEGGGGRSSGRAVDPRGPAPPHVLTATPCTPEDLAEQRHDDQPKTTRDGELRTRDREEGSSVARPTTGDGPPWRSPGSVTIWMKYSGTTPGNLAG